jgi:hypothetical protein
MISLECSRCGTVTRLTEDLINQLLVEGTLYLDCSHCGKEIDLERNFRASVKPNHSGLTETEIQAVQEMEDEIREDGSE